MTNVGFYGGSEVRGLGSASDMKAFFACVDLAIEKMPLDARSVVLTDRLYRRYLRLDELDVAAELLGAVRNVLAGIAASTLDWRLVGWDPSTTRLDPSSGMVADVLSRHLKGAVDLISNARSFEKRFNIYQPVITVITDTPRFYAESLRSLADYDALEGEPMWLR